jgi:hypothetical protein
MDGDTSMMLPPGANRMQADAQCASRSKPSQPSPAGLATGIGLRAPHHRAILESRPAVGFLEIHAENYMTDPAAGILQQMRDIWPISVHGVGLSLGGAEPLDRDHLTRLGHLVAGCEPLLVSEHIAWCRQGGVYLNDLLPLPYTEEALDVLADHVDEVQGHLGRQILMENPSTYLSYRHSTIGEGEFMAALAKRTGCGLLLDVNNLYVNQRNHGIDARNIMAMLDPAAVQEIHLAGHHEARHGHATILIDDHGSRVSDAVWALYDAALTHFNAPTLVEWDSRLPDLGTLVDEAARADARRLQHAGTDHLAAERRHDALG